MMSKRRAYHKQGTQGRLGKKKRERHYRHQERIQPRGNEASLRDRREFMEKVKAGEIL